MVAEPADTPVTTPEALMVATDVLLLLQVPPEVASDSAVVVPVHSVVVPVMMAGVAGAALTIIVRVIKAEPQPLPNV